MPRNKFCRRGGYTDKVIMTTKDDDAVPKFHNNNDNNPTVPQQKIFTSAPNTIGKSEIIKVMKHNTFLGGAIISSVPQINTKKKDRNNIVFKF